MNPFKFKSVIILLVSIAVIGILLPVQAAQSGEQNIFNIKDFGAKGNRSTNDAPAIQKAIDACSKAGGGMVYIPPGDFLTGPLFLKSNIDFHLEAGATLWATSDKSVYFEDGKVPTKNPRGSSEPHTGYQLINGQNLKNLSITGRGTINGQGSTYWWGIEKYRPYIMSLHNCENVLFEGITTLESPTHTFSFESVNHLVIRNITLLNDPKSPNTDGFHFSRCRDVLVSQVTMDTGDDCICVHNGTRDLTVSNCTFRTPWGAVYISNGSHISITNCVIECRMVLKDVGRAEYVVVSDIVAYGEGILFSHVQGQGRTKELKMSNIIATGFAQAGWLENAENIMLDNIRIIRKSGAGSDILFNGFDFKNINGLTLRHVEVENVESGPGLRCENISNLEIDGFQAKGLAESDPAILLSNVENSYIHACRALPGTQFLEIKGKETQDIRIASNDLRGAKISADKDVASTALQGVSVKYRALHLPETIHAGDTVTVQTSITNQSDRDGFCLLSLQVDSKEAAAEWIWLEGGEESNINLMLPPFYRAESHTFSVGDAIPVTRKIIGIPAKLVCKSLDVSTEIIPAGGAVQLIAEVQNIGSEAIKAQVNLMDGEQSVLEDPAVVDPGEVIKVTYAYTIDKLGVHDLSVLDADPVKVKVYDGAMNSLVLDLDMETIENDCVKDKSGLDHNLFLKCNPAGQIPQSVSWKFGQALEFDGHTSYGEIDKMLLCYPMTVSVWLKPDSLTASSVGGRQMILFASEPRGNDGFGPEDETHLARDAGDVLAFTTRNGNHFDVRQQLDLNDAPVFVTVVYDKTSRLFINGRVVDEVTGQDKVPDYSDYIDKLYVGRPTSAKLRFYHGIIDELRIYHEALSEEEVQQLYERYLKLGIGN